jgi:hypothetical protein
MKAATLAGVVPSAEAGHRAYRPPALLGFELERGEQADEASRAQFLIDHPARQVSDAGAAGRLAFSARQGEAIGRPGTVQVVVEGKARNTPTNVRIGGNAVIAFSTTIEVWPGRRTPATPDPQGSGAGWQP